MYIYTYFSSGYTDISINGHLSSPPHTFVKELCRIPVHRYLTIYFTSPWLMYILVVFLRGVGHWCKQCCSNIQADTGLWQPWGEGWVYWYTFYTHCPRQRISTLVFGHWYNNFLRWTLDAGCFPVPLVSGAVPNTLLFSDHTEPPSVVNCCYAGLLQPLLLVSNRSRTGRETSLWSY